MKKGKLKVKENNNQTSEFFFFFFFFVGGGGGACVLGRKIMLGWRSCFDTLAGAGLIGEQNYFFSDSPSDFVLLKPVLYLLSTLPQKLKQLT